jgi:hypothetical protein
MYKTSLSQGIGKRGNGSSQVANFDGNELSAIASHNRTRRRYHIEVKHGIVLVVLAQQSPGSPTHEVVVGEVDSHGQFGLKNAHILAIAKAIQCDPDRLITHIRKIAAANPAVEGISSRDRYGHEVGNRRKKAKRDRVNKGIRIC